MRTTKFRGKTADGVWVYGYLANSCYGHMILDELLNHVDGYEWNVYGHEVLSDTVGEFTGKYDISGNEIYEGDILKTFHFSDNGEDHFLYHVVTWSERLTGWQAVRKGQNGSEPNGNPQLWVYMNNSECEISGNIHEK